MANKVEFELDIAQVEKLVEKLPREEKIRLVRKLEQETLGQRMDRLLKKIDERRKRYPISAKEIRQEIEAVRKELYGRRCH